MAFSKEIYTQATAQMQQRRNTAEREAQQRKQEIYQRVPQIAQLQQQLSNTGLRVARSVLGLAPGEASAVIARLEQENQQLQRQISQLLQQNGYDADALYPRYHCNICEDTGYDGPYFCRCYRQLLTQLALEKLNRDSAMELCSFDTFSLDYYSTEPLPELKISPRDCMREIYAQCRSYAKNFALPSSDLPDAPVTDSMLFTGSTGLGKTHLSLAIAREVIEKGYGVLYVSAQNLLSQIEKEHFQREGRQTDTLELSCGCDLLILDDLGSEFQTQFTQSTIYHLLNTRMMKRLPFIISTNLKLSEIEKRYTERVVSRLLGCCHIYRFVGRDVRQIQFTERFKKRG